MTNKKKFARLIHPSTRAFIKEACRMQGFSIFDWLHGYVYGRWPYLYIGIGTGEHPLSRALSPLGSRLIRRFSKNSGPKVERRVPFASSPINLDSGTFADKYHGKVMTLESAKRLVTVNQEIRLTNLEKIIPYTHARDIILQNPGHIVALECPCRAGRANPCLPLDVCLIVGEPFASFVAEHHPRRSRWLESEEVLDTLQAEHERGHVHHAFFKDAMLGRFYAICNCCRCCCGAMQSWQRGTPMLAPSGYVSLVDEARCKGCGDCIESCPFGALSLVNEKAVVDTNLCMGCGVCVSRCDSHAHSLVRDPSKGEPLEIRDLLSGS